MAREWLGRQKLPRHATDKKRWRANANRGRGEEFALRSIAIAISLLAAACSGAKTPPSSPGTTASPVEQEQSPVPNAKADEKVRLPSPVDAADASDSSLEIAALVGGRDVPPCAEKLTGKVFFIEAEAVLKYCDGQKWLLLDLSGPRGEAGSPGNAGSAGVSGERGTEGLAGAQGLIGATGTQGPVGATGAQGSIGATGAQGLGGATGAQGATGATGASGSQGSTGATGFNSLVSVSSENVGANCSGGGKRIAVGLDNGDGGGTANDGILQAGEVDQTSYVCRGDDLRVLDGSSTLVGYLVSTFDYVPSANELRTAFLVRKDGIYSAFDHTSSAVNTGVVSQYATKYRAGFVSAVYESGNCSGQPYTEAVNVKPFIPVVEMYVPFLFSYHVTTGTSLRIDSTVATTKTLNSQRVCSVGPCDDLSDTSCDPYGPTSKSVVPISLLDGDAAVFPGSLTTYTVVP